MGTFTLRAALLRTLAILCWGCGVVTLANGQESAQVPPLPPHLEPGIPAFPGAWGGGMYTTGGRGGKVVTVTNLDDDGPGSFRAAVAVEGPRIVVFRVAGIIYLKDSIDIENPDITIAGQTAPGGGICIAHDSININTGNVIIRHLRVRRGKPEGGQGSDNIGGHPHAQVIIDHCSTSWGMDENLSLYRRMVRGNNGNRDVKLPARNLTVQFCISSEALDAKNHAFGGTWGGQDATFHHNLLACNTGRNPSIGMGGEFDFRNNVVFNWRHRTMDGGDETSMVNHIANYYKAGPATNENMQRVMVRIEERRQYSPGRSFESGDWFPNTEKRPGKWYIAGNHFEGHADITEDNWKGVRNSERGSASPLAKVLTPFEAWPVNQQTAQEAYESVLAGAGATLPRRDAVDRRVISSIRSGEFATKTGIVKDPKDVGGYPEYAFDPDDVRVDSDGDGMPDDWETEHQLNPATAADGPLDKDQDGYSNVEEFLNGTDPNEFIDYRNLGNNVDTISG